VGAITLGTALDSASNADVLVEAPVRTFEIMEIAPVTQSGVDYLGARSVSAGDVVQSGGALFTIVNPSTMRLEASVPANELASVRPLHVTNAGSQFMARQSATVQPVQDTLVRWVTLRNSPLP
jgi:hypothetical protein